MCVLVPKYHLINWVEGKNSIGGSDESKLIYLLMWQRRLQRRHESWLSIECNLGTGN